MQNTTTYNFVETSPSSEDRLVSVDVVWDNDTKKISWDIFFPEKNLSSLDWGSGDYMHLISCLQAGLNKILELQGEKIKEGGSK